MPACNALLNNRRQKDTSSLFLSSALAALLSGTLYKIRLFLRQDGLLYGLVLISPRPPRYAALEGHPR